jgi:hypothetical protein
LIQIYGIQIDGEIDNDLWLVMQTMENQPFVLQRLLAVQREVAQTFFVCLCYVPCLTHSLFATKWSSISTFHESLAIGGGWGLSPPHPDPKNVHHNRKVSSMQSFT